MTESTRVRYEVPIRMVSGPGGREGVRKEVKEGLETLRSLLDRDNGRRTTTLIPDLNENTDRNVDPPLTSRS